MADYVARQENVTLKYDADVEVVTPAVEKIQFSASGDVAISPILVGTQSPELTLHAFLHSVARKCST